MRTVLIFVSVYLLSLLAAFIVGIQLADFFRSQEEFIAIMMALIIFSLLAIVAFAIAYRLAKTVRLLGIVAISLAVAAVVLEELPALAEAFAQRSTNPFRLAGAQDIAIAAMLLIPAFVMLLIQWPLLRRRWLAARGAEYRTAWPWITITVAGLIFLNRLGFDVIASAIRQSPDDMLATFWLKVTVGIAATLLSLGLIEWGRRRRRLAQRTAA